MTRTVLVVGGAGVFGSRLVELLARSCDCRILVAVRTNATAAQTVAALAARKSRATLQPWTLDRDKATADDLRATGAAIVVDAAGPFQGADLRLAATAIEAGCHYVDLADARDYVAAFPRLNALALQSQVLAVCGASSTPALSHAAIDRLRPHIGAAEEAAVYISPGNRAPRGLSVVRAILSYAGKPVQLWEQRKQRAVAGWSGLHRRELSDLGRRWFSICETPDLDLIPARLPDVATARFFAGLELGVLHCGLWALSLLVRARLVPSLTPYARLLLAVANSMRRFGTDRGGMLVEISGWDSGTLTLSRWVLVAEAGDGPYVPVLPALAIIRRLLSGDETARGAQACVGLLTLEEIFAGREDLRIRTYEDHVRITPLFERAVGVSFQCMPRPIQELHRPNGVTRFSGTAQIDGAASFIGEMTARLFRFPRADKDVPVEVTLQPRKGGEHWHRRFGRASFSSVLAMDQRTGELAERFGLVCCTVKCVSHEHGLDMKVIGARLGPIPLPRFLVPWTRAYERVDAQGRFTFDVEVGLPRVGRLVRYRGWLLRRTEP